MTPQPPINLTKPAKDGATGEDKMIIYAAQHTDCIYESGYSIISLHKTETGAQKALEAHRQQQREHARRTLQHSELMDAPEGADQVDHFLGFEGWKVSKIEVME